MHELMVTCCLKFTNDGKHLQASASVRKQWCASCRREATSSAVRVSSGTVVAEPYSSRSTTEAQASYGSLVQIAGRRSRR